MTIWMGRRGPRGCRQRGLDWLDRKSRNQGPVRAAALQRPARDPSEPRNLSRLVGSHRSRSCSGRDRRAGAAGRPADAGLLSDLFFGDAGDGTIKRPVCSQTRTGKMCDATEARFRERRANVMRFFAEVPGGSAAPHGRTGRCRAGIASRQSNA